MLKPENLARGVLSPKLLQKTTELAEIALEPGLDSEEHPDIPALIDELYLGDEVLQKILSALRSNERTLPSELPKEIRRHISMADCMEKHGKVLYKGRIWVPAHDSLRTAIVRACHDIPSAGHPGRSKTYALLAQTYYWPDVYDQVRRYVLNCHVCRRSKASRQPYSGQLLQLPIPERPWTEIAIDFVVELPDSRSHEGVTYRNIMVVTDRLTKWRYYIPCRRMDAVNSAKHFLRFVFSRHGLPNNITSDRGT
jgi:hypothetical protein